MGRIGLLQARAQAARVSHCVHAQSARLETQGHLVHAEGNEQSSTPAGPCIDTYEPPPTHTHTTTSSCCYASSATCLPACTLPPPLLSLSLPLATLSRPLLRGVQLLYAPFLTSHVLFSRARTHVASPLRFVQLLRAPCITHHAPCLTHQVFCVVSGT